MLNRPRATLWSNPKWDDLTGKDSRSVRNGETSVPGQVHGTSTTRGYQDRYTREPGENRFKFTLARHSEKSARVNKSSPFYNAQSQIPQSASQSSNRRGYGSGLSGGNQSCCSTGNTAVYSANSVPDASHSSTFATSPASRRGKGRKGGRAAVKQEKFTFTSLFPRDERGGRKSGLKCNIFHQYQKDCLCKACQGVRDNVSLPARYGTEESFVESKHALTNCNEQDGGTDPGAESKGRNKLRMAIAMTRECGFAQMPSKSETGTQQQHFRIFSDAVPNPPAEPPKRPQPTAPQPREEEGAGLQVGLDDLLDFDLSIRDSPKQAPPAGPPSPPAAPAPAPAPDAKAPGPGVAAGLPTGASDTRIRPTEPYKGPKVPNSHLWQPSGRVGSLGPTGPSTKPPRPIAKDPQSTIVRSGYYVKRR